MVPLFCGSEACDGKTSRRMSVTADNLQEMFETAAVLATVVPIHLAAKLQDPRAKFRIKATVLVVNGGPGKMVKCPPNLKFDLVGLRGFRTGPYSADLKARLERLSDLA